MACSCTKSTSAQPRRTAVIKKTGSTQHVSRTGVRRVIKRVV